MRVAAALLAAAPAAASLTYGAVYANGSIVVSAQPPLGRGTDAVAWAAFNDTITENGWSSLVVETSKSFNESSQAYAAGRLEAWLTVQRSYEFTMNAVIDSGQLWPQDLTDYIDANTAYVKAMAAANGDSDPFWFHSGLTLTQWEGFYAGYTEAAPSSMALGYYDLYGGSLVGDLFDLVRSTAERR